MGAIAAINMMLTATRSKISLVSMINKVSCSFISPKDSDNTQYNKENSSRYKEMLNS